LNITPAEELVYAMQTICRKYSIKSDDLIMVPDRDVFRFDNAFEEYELGCYRIRRIPVEIPLPLSMQTAEMKQFDLLQLGLHNRTYLAGIGEFSCVIDEVRPYYKSKNRITFWSFYGQQDVYHVRMPVYFVQKKDWTKLYYILKKRSKRRGHNEPPILPKQMLQDLHNNTIGFLMKGAEAFRAYNIPFKRGIILAGEPGNGKTHSCRWIREICMSHNWNTLIVNLSRYRTSCSRGTVERLFNPFPDKKGIVFFDDLDVLLHDRKSGNAEVSNFLSGLDGIEVQKGIVHIFTTNEFEGLDKAAIRPGRIDLFLKMRKPTEALRREFVEKKFPQEVLEAIDIDSLLEESHDYSFAELEEIRKLFCLDLIDKKPVDLNKVIKLYNLHREDFPNYPSLGFGAEQGHAEPSEGYFNEEFDFGFAE